VALNRDRIWWHNYRIFRELKNSRIDINLLLVIYIGIGNAMSLLKNIKICSKKFDYVTQILQMHINKYDITLKLWKSLKTWSASILFANKVSMFQNVSRWSLECSCIVKFTSSVIPRYITHLLPYAATHMLRMEFNGRKYCGYRRRKVQCSEWYRVSMVPSTRFEFLNYLVLL